MEDLEDGEKILFEHATPENLLYTTSATQKLHDENNRFRNPAGTLQPLVDAVSQYGAALDVYSNASSVILCLLWGSIRVLLNVCISSRSRVVAGLPWETRTSGIKERCTCTHFNLSIVRS